MRQYDHKKIEKKWQKVWKETGLYKTRKLKDSKFYILDMFPYPSGEGLHVGHPKGYIATDVVSRMKRMQGHSVLHPMGFDAFGLPAENYAIKTKTNPETAVKKNIARYKKQLEILGFDYDWSREINTTDPNYYKWTQWIFLQLFKNGLAYQSNEPINWCPSCKTGLANEDVENGRCERCGTPVEKRPMRQWVLKITDYAERLLSDLDKLGWPEHIKEQQRNWIGKSEGALIKFQITSSPPTNRRTGKSQTNSKFQIPIEVFTTRADTLFGATYLVLSPEHSEIPKNKSQITNWAEVGKYIIETKKKTEIERTVEGKDKTGIEIKGIKASNPANGEEIPIFVADYVLPDYGTGAIMAVPAHDERDWQFSKKFSLPIKEVITGGNVSEQAYIGVGKLINSGKFDGMESKTAARAITEFVGGKITTKYKLRDWVFSRQRYWGEPIPLIFCETCKKQAELNAKRYTLNAGETLNPGWIAAPEKNLPVKLPKVKYYEPTGTGESPLAGIEKWVNVKCPRCGGKGKRETNTMPQWAGSSWYYAAYCISGKHKSQAPNSKQIPNLKSQKSKHTLQKWLPVDLYVGGAEHATRHLIYARFWHKFLQDIGVVSTPEPFMKLRPVGLIMGEDGRKMSKRFGNVINPDDIVGRFGADSLRVYEMFMGPFDQAIAWNTDGVVGAKRFLEKVWRLREKAQSTVHNTQTPKDNKLPTGQAKHRAQNTKLQTLLHQTIKKVTEDIEAMRFNTAISALMILTNEMEKTEKVDKKDFEIFLRLLAPFAPHMTEELWEGLGYKKSVHLTPWPKYDLAKLLSDKIKIVVQVNGKTRGSLEIGRDLPQTEVEKQATTLPAIAKWLAGKTVKKVIYVPNRLLNFVVA